MTAAEASPDGSDLILRQTAHGTTPGVWGCQWSIAGLSAQRVALIVPAWSGVRFRADTPFREGVFDWPGAWEAQTLIVQGPSGGMWVRADDPDDRFKGLWIRRRRGLFDLGFRTYNEGTPSSHKEAEWVTPAKTLLYAPNWRRDGYDLNYPDYTAHRGFKELVDVAHQLGFIVTVNGQVASRLDVSGPDGWHPVTVDLGAYAGETILLSLVADAMGNASCDWARWGEPRIAAR